MESAHSQLLAIRGDQVDKELMAVPEMYDAVTQVEQEDAMLINESQVRRSSTIQQKQGRLSSAVNSVNSTAYGMGGNMNQYIPGAGPNSSSLLHSNEELYAHSLNQINSLHNTLQIERDTQSMSGKYNLQGKGAWEHPDMLVDEYNLKNIHQQRPTTCIPGKGGP